jgi:hypothetical protein
MIKPGMQFMRDELLFGSVILESVYTCAEKANVYGYLTDSNVTVSPNRLVTCDLNTPATVVLNEYLMDGIFELK